MNFVKTSNKLNHRIGNKQRSLLLLLQEQVTRLGLQEVASVLFSFILI